jgi:alpha-glucosidase
VRATVIIVESHIFLMKRLMDQIDFPAWLASLHHDGSPDYVSNTYPVLGESVQLRLRVEAAAPIQRALLRIFPDGEQAFLPMIQVESPAHLQFWTVELPIRMPATHYRFLLQSADGVWWHSAAGPSAFEPLDQTDFQILAGYNPPAWVQESVFYQIFPDRFANGDPANDPRPEDYEYRGQRPQTLPWGSPPLQDQHPGIVFYGGDLPGITQHLDYLADLGVNALYLTPVFTALSNHKYDVMDYEHVDPHFGGDEALVELRRGLDQLGMRYLLDIVPNHCGWAHPWFQRARQSADAAEADFFTFRQRPDDYESWLGVWSLPKLNYRSAGLCQAMYAGQDAVFRRWLRPPFRADGWRVDVANMLGRQGEIQMGEEVAHGLRAAVKETDPQAYLIGENFFDATRQLQGDQWDGVMNYAGFATPLLHWLSGVQISAIGLKEPVNGPALSTQGLAAVWRSRLAGIPWAVALQQYNLLGSHETMRARSHLAENDALHRLAVTILLTYPGVPGLYYGDEIGMLDQPGLRSRACIEWDSERWDHDLRNFFKDLIHLRRSSPALQRGGFQIVTVEEHLIAFQRSLGAERWLVIAQRSASPRPAGPLDLRSAGLPDGTRLREHFSGQEALVRGGWLDCPVLPQGATLWKMDAC